MSGYLAVLAGGIIASLLAAYHSTGQARKAVAAVAQKSHVHQMVAMLLVVAHASQIGHVVEQLSWLHIVVALGIFALWMGTRIGTAELD